MPSFYNNVEDLADPPQAYYFKVNAVNISENVSNSDLVSIMKTQEIEWVEQISSLN